MNEATPGTSGTPDAAIAALGWSGVSAPWVFAGVRDAPAFEGYVEFAPAPTLRRGDIVAVGNLSAHQQVRICSPVETRGARVPFAPPYSPDVNPIELCWAKAKAALQAAKARPFDALAEALARASLSLSLDDLQAWFAHCSYALP